MPPPIFSYKHPLSQVFPPSPCRGLRTAASTTSAPRANPTASSPPRRRPPDRPRRDSTPSPAVPPKPQVTPAPRAVLGNAAPRPDAHPLPCSLVGRRHGSRRAAMPSTGSASRPTDGLGLLAEDPPLDLLRGPPSPRLRGICRKLDRRRSGRVRWKATERARAFFRTGFRVHPGHAMPHAVRRLPLGASTEAPQPIPLDAPAHPSDGPEVATQIATREA